MPKETFNHLSEDKKNKILFAAVDEFSKHCFSDASINQIIKSAGIPRGSFYQYFDNKEDLYLFVFSKIMQEGQDILHKEESLDPNADALEIFIRKTVSSLKVGKTKPEYKKIIRLMEKDRSDFITGLLKLSDEDKKRVTDMIENDKKRGIYRADVDSGLVIDMVYTMTLKQCFQSGFDDDLFLRSVKSLIQIIKEGILGKEEQIG